MYVQVTSKGNRQCCVTTPFRCLPCNYCWCVHSFIFSHVVKPVVMRSSAKPVDAIVMGGTAKAQSPWYLTSTKQAYPPPALVSSNLRTKGTHRHTYTDRRVAVGVLPTANIDMYTEPEYTTPSYTTDFCDPSMR